MKRFVLPKDYRPLKFIFYLLIIILCFPRGVDGQNDVWPGDANRDGKVDNFDILAIGYAFGTVGPTRSIVDGTFAGVPVALWPDFLPVSAINFGYLDCNGDGIIDTFDIIVVDSNYSKEQITDVAVQTVDSLIGGLVGVIAFDVPADTLVTGDTLMIKIDLTSPGFPAIPDTVLGISFTINYNASLTRDSTTAIHIDPSWLGGTATTVNYANVLNTDLAAKTSGVKNEAGVIDITIIDKQLAQKSGTGEISVVCIIMDENVAKALDSVDMVMQLTIDQVKMITASEQTIPVQIVNDSVVFRVREKCKRIGGIHAIPVTDNVAMLKWDPSDQAEAYEIQGRPAGTNNWISIGVNPLSNPDFFESPPLPLNHHFEWKVRAICTFSPTPVASPWSQISAFSSGCLPPYKLSTSKVNGVVRLEWSPVLGATSYTILGRAVGSSNIVSLPVPIIAGAQSNFFDIPGLPPLQYQWAMRSHCVNGISLLSAINTFAVSIFSADSSSKLEALNELTIYPNPAHDQISIRISEALESVAHLRIFNLQGKLMLEKRIPDEQADIIQMDVGKLGDGVYFVHLATAEQIMVRKFVIEK